MYLCIFQKRSSNQTLYNHHPSNPSSFVLLSPLSPTASPVLIHSVKQVKQSLTFQLTFNKILQTVTMVKGKCSVLKSPDLYGSIVIIFLSLFRTNSAPLSTALFSMLMLSAFSTLTISVPTGDMAAVEGRGVSVSLLQHSTLLFFTFLSLLKHHKSQRPSILQCSRKSRHDDLLLLKFPPGLKCSRNNSRKPLTHHQALICDPAMYVETCQSAPYEYACDFTRFHWNQFSQECSDYCRCVLPVDSKARDVKEVEAPIEKRESVSKIIEERNEGVSISSNLPLPIRFPLSPSHQTNSSLPSPNPLTNPTQNRCGTSSAPPPAPSSHPTAPATHGTTSATSPPATFPTRPSTKPVPMAVFASTLLSMGVLGAGDKDRSR